MDISVFVPLQDLACDPLALLTTAFHCFKGAGRGLYVIETTPTPKFESYSAHHFYQHRRPDCVH
jgi:hypothetical protein